MGHSMPSTEIRTKCWICGKEVISNDKKRSFCPECLSAYKEDLKDKRSQMVYLKKFFMFDRAMELLEKQGHDFNKHREEIEAVKDKFWENPDKFDSADEIMAALILVENRIYAKMQYKIARYQVDFLLPDYHVILEIDGDRHRYRVGCDSVRDESIKYLLCPDWEIIRIPTKCIEQNANKLIIAINKILEVRENGGKVNWREVYKN